MTVSIQTRGILLFCAGLSIFLMTSMMSHYQLSPAVIQQSISNPYHQLAISAVAQNLYDKTYTKNYLFINDLNKVLHLAQKEQDAKAKLVHGQATALPEGVAEWDFRLGDLNTYRFKLVKNSSTGFLKNHIFLLGWLSFGLGSLGALLSILSQRHISASSQHHGIFHNSMQTRGGLGIITSIFLILFYVLLYWYPEYITNWVWLVEPISQYLSGNVASQWFLYGFLYSLCVLVMGVRMWLKYRHQRYQQIRTLSIVFFQTIFAFLIPELLVKLHYPYFDFKNMWPLKYDFFFEWHLNSLLNSGNLGIFMLVWGIALFVIGVPVLTYFFGKRWYCSWVCGCGGLAETLGDPYRHLSNKSLQAWKIERYLIHGVLAFAVLMTLLVLYTYFTGKSNILWIDSYTVRSWYGFLIGSAFAGVVGTGFYPLMGNRVWCRFGCPLAAYLGLVQRFKSRFRITVNGGQCISCGNCSTYCEMGIDVRAYAQRGQDIVRASCVGCGICASVCPRGVLRLENDHDVAQRAKVERVIHVPISEVKLLDK